MKQETALDQGLSISDKNLALLKVSFPSCFNKEGEFNLETFKDLLGQSDIPTSLEHSGLSFFGKKAAISLTSTASNKLISAVSSQQSAVSSQQSAVSSQQSAF